MDRNPTQCQQHKIQIESGTYHYHNHSILIPDLTIRHGEVIGLKGVSGSGKSTLGKILTGQLSYAKNSLLLPTIKRKQANPVQWVGQRCEFAFNPRWTIEKSLKEAYRGKKFSDLFEQYELESHWQFRYPHELSGGQLQRFNLVRALIPSTEFLICDEATDQLDAVTQKIIWQAIQEEVTKRSLGLLVITHQSALLNAVCDRIVTMPSPEQSAFLSTTKHTLNAQSNFKKFWL